MTGEEPRYEARFDGDEQELLLTFDLLAECAPLVPGGRGAEQLPEDARSALRSAEVLGDADEPVPLLTLVAEAVEGAVVEIVADVATPGGTGSSLAILGPASALIAVPASVGGGSGATDVAAAPSEDVGDLARIGLVAPDELPYRLLALLDVQARPHLDAPAVKLPRGALDALLAAPGGEAEEAVQEVFGRVEGLPEGMLTALIDLVGSVRLHWSVTSSIRCTARPPACAAARSSMAAMPGGGSSTGQTTTSCWSPSRGATCWRPSSRSCPPTMSCVSWRSGSRVRATGRPAR